MVTMQAVSGAGYPGVSSMDIMDNVVPYISGEEEKMEQKEPQKLLGTFDGQGIHYADFVVSAHCNRVATRNGHLEAVSVEFATAPTQEEILEAWRDYKPLAQQLNLPSAPQPAILYDDRPDRPQPRLDRMAGSVPGMATVVGRLRPDPLVPLTSSWCWATTPSAVRPAAACSTPSCWWRRAMSVKARRFRRNLRR